MTQEEDMYERACLHGWPLVGPDGEPDDYETQEDDDE